MLWMRTTTISRRSVPDAQTCFDTLVLLPVTYGMTAVRNGQANVNVSMDVWCGGVATSSTSAAITKLTAMHC